MTPDETAPDARTVRDRGFLVAYRPRQCSVKELLAPVIMRKIPRGSAFTPTLSNALRQALRDDGRTQKFAHQSRGKFDVRAIPRALAGATDVFRSKVETRASYAAVEILLDISQSMHGDSIRRAVEMTLAMGDSMAAAGVPFEVHGFGDPAPYTGAPSCTLFAAKTFAQPWAGRVQVVNSLKRECKFGTHCFPAIMAAGERLLEKVPGAGRKVVFILTDGQDTYGGAGGLASELLASRGITVCALGLGTRADHLAARKELAVLVPYHGNLADAGLGLVLKTLKTA
jgi:hypothetical protein